MAPALPGGSSGGLDIPGLVSGAQAGITGAGQVVLGLLAVAVGLLLVLSETRAGGQLARGVRRTAERLVAR